MHAAIERESARNGDVRERIAERKDPGGTPQRNAAEGESQIGS